MIDWTSGKINLLHDPKLLRSGAVVSIDSDGDIEWETRKRTVIEGSYSSKFTIRSEDLLTPDIATSLSFSGNPVKFLQGHNVFGSSDLTGLIYEAVLKCLKTVGIPISDIELGFLFGGNYRLSRVDINYMFSLETRTNVLSWLYAAERSSRTRMGKGHFAGETLYFQKKSTRWALKFYSKGLEINASGHQLPRELTLGDSIQKYADDKLRAELTLRTKELTKLGLDMAHTWGDNEPYDVWLEYIGRLEMSEQKTADELIYSLPKKLRTTFILWRDGLDVRQIVSRNTYFKHKKELLSYGVDISIKVDKKTNNVTPISKATPLLHPLKMSPCDVPEWATETNLYFEPRKAL